MGSSTQPDRDVSTAQEPCPACAKVPPFLCCLPNCSQIRELLVGCPKKLKPLHLPQPPYLLHPHWLVPPVGCTLCSLLLIPARDL